MLERFTDTCRPVLRTAYAEWEAASEAELLRALFGLRRAPPVTRVRLLRALFGLRRALATRAFGPTIDVILAEVEERFPDPPADGFDIGKRDLTGAAAAEAKRRGENHVGTEHLLLALARMPGSWLASVGVGPERVEQALAELNPPRPAGVHPARRLGRAVRAVGKWLKSRFG